jgi:glycosyltransferase involved in cell wall biosynthesis
MQDRSVIASGTIAKAPSTAIDNRRPIKIGIVTPVFNDWQCFRTLLEDIDAVLAPTSVRCHVLVVNDGSSRSLDLQLDYAQHSSIHQIDFVDLACNLGHQRAIAVGLVAANQLRSIEGVIVMDADGEDRPEDILRLLSVATGHPGEIVCAQRTRRSESLTFIIWYFAYKAIFRLLCGVSIDFGNFCYIPKSALTSIVHNAFIWNHLAACIVRSRLAFRRIHSDRGLRYGGRSTMSFQSLVLHGLSAISVYSDVVLVRILLMTVFMATAAFVGVLVVVIVRIFTELAIPGWATNAAGVLAILFAQAVLLATVATCILLSLRTGRPIVPASDALTYVISIEHRVSDSAAGGTT